MCESAKYSSVVEYVFALSNPIYYAPLGPGVLPSSINDDTILSQSSFCESNSTSTKSNLLSSGLANATLTLMDCVVSYWPLGLVEASMVARVLSLHTRPACMERKDIGIIVMFETNRTNTKSNLLSSGLANATLTLMDCVGSYWLLGFVEASMVARSNHETKQSSQVSEWSEP